jgi:hypothetical protein
MNFKRGRTGYSLVTGAVAGCALALLLALGVALAAGETISLASLGSGGGEVSSTDGGLTLNSSLGAPIVGTGSSSSASLCSGPRCGPGASTSATNPPALIGTSPADGSTAVSLDQPVRITFSRAMDTGSVSYTIEPSVSGISESWSSGDTVLTLSHDPFDADTSYTVTVTAASDTEGQALTNAPFSWSFTTASERGPASSTTLYLPLVTR